MDILHQISDVRKLETSFVEQVLNPPPTIEFIDTFEKYEDLYRIRHDYTHWHICKERGLVFGEKALEDIPELKDIHEDKYWNLIKKQSPDILYVHRGRVNIIEITVSTSRLARKEKISKYALLIDILKKHNYSVSLEIVVVPTQYSFASVQALMSDHKLSRDCAENIQKVVSKISRLIHSVEATPYGQLWYSRRHDNDFKDIDLGISNDDVIRYHNESNNKCFHRIEDLQQFLKHDVFDSEIDDDDNKFINKVVDIADEFEPTFSKNEDFESSIINLRKYHDKFANTKKYRAIYPLPFLQGLIIDSSIRNTDDDESEFVKFKSKLFESGDSFFMKISQMQEHRGRIHLNESEKSNIALQGPGRKHYIKKGSLPHIDKQKKNRNYWFNYQQTTYERDLDELSIYLSKIEKFDTENPNNIQGLGLELLRCSQSIFREININAMRSDRRHDMIFKPTGVDGVYLLIYMGPKLRTGENLSTIWFKLFTTQEKIPITAISSHWAFKSWNIADSFLHTDWVSIDANRLDHYIRCYDRIVMAYLSYLHGGREHIESEIENDQSNTLGIILLIYMEDRRSTSKMLQDVRYLVMGALSKFRWWKSLLEKYQEPVRSPLQAYCLAKIEKFSIEIHTNLKVYIENFRFGKVYQESDNISDKLAGATSLLPRVLTKGPKIHFKQLLCEMYFTMLFNKNQDDPTHATFQILNKMLEGEDSLRWVKENTELHMGGQDMFGDIETLINNPHKNQFSKHAIMIGSKLQSLDPNNKSPAGLAHQKAANNKKLNKPLSEFATYKSSAVFTRGTYNDKVRIGKDKIDLKNNKLKDALEEKYREGGEDDEDPVDKEFVRQNPRRRCIEGIIQLLNEGKMRSFDVILSTMFNEMYYQVFKKNQIGGAREILILPIEKRITINILETFSRLICRDDTREMLTHGDSKLIMMKGMVRDIRRTNETRRIVLNYNLDKTRWGPSFMPIQFVYMFKPFANKYPKLFNFILLTLMVHTNKKCLIPEKLINIWLKDRENDKIHNEPLLQNLKNEFLEKGKLFFENESNMGQGILHYTSSYMHLCALSFRDIIYKKLCERRGISTGVWKDIVSSDDSYTAHALPMDGIMKVRYRIELFLKAQEVTERLFNIWTSKSKSSISFLISEFNSMFGSNLTLYPTLFKFALASVMPNNTDSFFRMVKESYNTTRQIVENGGSLELYLIAHKLNKTFTESIYHTYVGGVNDFKLFGLRREFVPYQLGVYPIMDPGIMLLIGPECHNYRIHDELSNLNHDERNLFNTCHNLIPIKNPELYAEMNSFENIFTGMLRIEAATGPIKKLQRIKRQIDMSWEEMQSIIEKDLTVLLRESRSMDEMKLNTYIKLFNFGASEALRDTASSIYYARVSATVTAKAFHIPYHDTMKATFDNKERKMIGFTYQECIRFLIEYHNGQQTLDQFYPNMNEYKILKTLSYQKPNYHQRHVFETQNVRTLQLSEMQMRLKNPIRDLIESFWIREEPDKSRSYLRDWVTLKELVPIINDSLELTLKNISGDRINKIKMLLLVLMRIMGNHNKPMKAVIYGPSSRTYDQSYLTLIQQNLFASYTSTELIITESIEANPNLYDKLYYYHNVFVLSKYYKVDREIKFEDIPIDNYLRDNRISQSSKKRIMMVLMHEGFLDDYKVWTKQTHSIMHQWDERQVKNEDGQWVGNFSLLVQCGTCKLKISKDWNKIHVMVNDLTNPVLTYELLKHAGEMVQKTVQEIVMNLPKGKYLVLTDRIIRISDSNGVHMEMGPLDDVHINVGDLTIEDDNGTKFLMLTDTAGIQVMRTPFGLLPTEYIPDPGEFEDFTINGMSIMDLSKIRIFKSGFDFADVDPEEIVKIIPDLIVTKPKISEVTLHRLDDILTGEWETKDIFNYYDQTEDEYNDESIIDDLMITELKYEDIKESLNYEPDPLYDSLLNPELSWDLVNNLPLVRAVHTPQRILERIIYCKYHFIARSCTDPRTLSKETIKQIYMQTLNKGIVYSLIFLYDRLYTTKEVSSPPSIDVMMRKSFIEKFLSHKQIVKID